MSEAAENLLGRIVALGEEYPDRWVPDDVLWPAANLSYDDYVDAAAELVESGLAESQADASGFPFLRDTPEGVITNGVTQDSEGEAQEWLLSQGSQPGQ